jgi:hypothetical protein
MLTRTKIAVATAFVLASASGVLAQNLNGSGIPSDVYSGYYSQADNAFSPQAEEADPLAPRDARGTHHHRHRR